MYKMGLFFAILVSFSVIQGEKPYEPVREDPLYQNYIWHSYQELDGKGFQTMTESVDGSMWFGLLKGVMHYDKINWMLFAEGDELPAGPFTTIFEDVERDLSIYAGSTTGLYVYQSSHWQLSPFFQGRPVTPVNRIKKSISSGFLISTTWGIFHVDKGKIVKIVTCGSMTAGLKSCFPEAQLIIIPDNATMRESWRTGFGVYTLGKVITDIAPGSPADEAGVSVGDMIESIEVLNGEESSVTISLRYNGTSVTGKEIKRIGGKNQPPNGLDVEYSARGTCHVTGIY
jgi:hypothetical protein